MSDLSMPWSVEALACEMLGALAVPAWWHAPGQPLHANAALMRLCGLDAESLLATCHLDLVVAQDGAALAAATQECLDGSGEPPAQSMRLLTRNGTERPVELTLRRVQFGQQRVVLVTCVDLSDFQHVQGMLLSMGSMLRQIIDSAPVAVYVIDREHRVTHWNGACEGLTGLSADEVLGSADHWRALGPQARVMLADSIVDGRDPVAVEAALGGHAQPSSVGPGAFEQEWRMPSPPLNGADERWLHITAVPLLDANRQVAGAIVTLLDISQRRRTEEQLTRRLEQMVSERSAELAAHARLMDAFIDNAPMGVVYTVNDRVVRANRRMAEIFGAGQGAAQQGAQAIGYHADAVDTERLRELARPLFARMEPLHQELWLHDQSGRQLWVQVNAFPIEYGDEATGAWWMLQDRTEVRAAQEELRHRFDELTETNQRLEQAQNQLLQQDKMASIGQLAAGVAHEINNPVGFVSSNLHTLRQYVDALLQLVDAQGASCASPQDDGLRARLREVEKDVELDYLREDLPQLLDESADGLTRVKKIVQDLKDFSRVDQADWQQADLNAGLESTLNVVRHEVKYKAEVVKQLQPLPLVMCLAAQLNQVFMNLIVNASHAIADKGVITLSSGHQDGWVWVQVEDTGCGMSEDVRRRIFEPFFTTKDVGKGTGLGLSLSFSIVKRHEGRIEVRSTQGVGSAFRVWVPVGGPQAACGQPAGEPPVWA
ncbi:MAG: hypothetical protein RLY78_3544 [Pseudomonadota bacterium]|jgi:PAS domain S-box-containing protein